MLVWCAASLAILIPTSHASAGVMLDLVHEFDGNSPLGTTSFGTVAIVNNGSAVDFTILANTSNLMGGDIHQLGFNLPSGITGLAVSNSSGISNRAIGAFSILDPNPNIAGKAGASFDWGVSFGNGGGPPGNGTLTQATFTLSADQALSMNDFMSEMSTPNNTPAVYLAVHFQDTNIFNATSETMGGGGGSEAPEPNSAMIWGLSLFGLAYSRRRKSKLC